MTSRFYQPGRVALTGTLAAAIALGVGATATTPAFGATDVTPAEAAILETRIRDGIAALLPPSFSAPDRPVQVTASGDHFNMTVPFASEALDGSGTARITGTARPATDRTWTVDDIRITSPLRSTYTMSGSADDGSARVTVSTVVIEGQDGHLTWDPSFATTSTLTMSSSGTTDHTEAGALSQETTVGPGKSTTTLRPSGAGRSDLLLDATLQDYVVDMLMRDVPLHLGMQRLRVNTALSAFNRDKAVTLIQALSGLLVTYFAPTPDGQRGAPSPTIAPAVIHTVLGALQDFAAEYTIDQTIEGFAAKLQDQVIGIDRLKVGLSARSESGLLQAELDVDVDGLVVPDLPLRGATAFIPRKVALRPVISGLDVNTLTSMANSAADGRTAAPADIQSIFGHGGIHLALEGMTVDVAGTLFTGHARMTAAGPSGDQCTGTAQLLAEHFDELMQKISATPELTQIMPILVFAKGIGRSSNNQLVWDLGYRDGRLFVNNMDMTAIMGGGGPNRTGTDGGPKTAPPRSPNLKQPPNRSK